MMRVETLTWDTCELCCSFTCFSLPVPETRIMTKPAETRETEHRLLEMGSADKKNISIRFWQPFIILIVFRWFRHHTHLLKNRENAIFSPDYRLTFGHFFVSMQFIGVSWLQFYCVCVCVCFLFICISILYTTYRIAYVTKFIYYGCIFIYLPFFPLLAW